MTDVFISHSARGDDFAMAVLKEIETRLTKEKQCHVLVDQNGIPPGDEWRPDILHWLARCHAAVVLVNDKALKSTWVQREVNILMWRRALGAPLTVVPVLLGEVAAGAVKKAGLDELWPIQFARTPQGGKHDVTHLVNLVLERFATLPEPPANDDPMSAWLKRLTTYLSKTDEPDRLTDAATALAVEDEYLPNVTAPQGGCRYLAHQFIAAPADRIERAVNVLGPGLPDDVLRRLVAELVAAWVSAEAARRVLPAADGEPDRMTVLLNAGRHGTATQYIRRATCGATFGYEVRSTGDLPVGEGRATERFRLWEREVWRMFFDAHTEDDRVLPNDVLKRIHYLVIDKRDLPDVEFAKAVTLLHEAFSWLVVMVTTGTGVPDEGIRDAFGKPVLLEPLLSASQEVTEALRTTRLRQLPATLAGTNHQFEESS